MPPPFYMQTAVAWQHGSNTSSETDTPGEMINREARLLSSPVAMSSAILTKEGGGGFQIWIPQPPPTTLATATTAASAASPSARDL